MTYLLDTNVFIQFKDESSNIEKFLEFLKWLELKNKEGIVQSIDIVYDELQKGNDILTTWSRSEGRGLFKTTDYPEIYPIVKKIHVFLKSSNYTYSQIKKFNRSADFWLVAHAIAKRLTIVSLEDRKYRGKIKIPVICDEFDVPYISTSKMLQLESY